MSEFNDALPKFVAHVLFVTNQFTKFAKMNLNLGEDEAYMLFDFSINYQLKYHKAIHSAYFGASQKQATTQRGAIYYTSNNSVNHVGFASLSDSMVLFMPGHS